VSRHLDEPDPTDAAAVGRREPPRRRGQRSQRRLANGLVALSSAAVVAVYAAGYARTEPAAASLAGAAPTAAGVVATPSSAAAAPNLSPAASATPTASGVASRQPASARPGQSSAARAGAATPTPAVPAAPAGASLRDGVYVGSGSSRHGGIEATVTIRGGQIVSAEITRCGTRYPCSRIAALAGQVIARQGAAVDFVSGATDSSRAYQAAVTAALAKAR
jgi:uncharacterized protein with FMN-binding domain